MAFSLRQLQQIPAERRRLGVAGQQEYTCF